MLEYWIWLAERIGISARIKGDLLRHFGSPQAVYQARESDWMQVEGITEQMLEVLKDKDLEPIYAIEEKCDKAGVKILTWDDPDYPDRLRNIYDPPILLYYKGTLPEFDELPVIGIVGTRKASAYGLGAAQRLGYEISLDGGVVVSGLAAGIDGAAMQGALRGDSPVVGVLGCGIDVVYPRSNWGLYRDVERFGCILSEYAPGVPGARWTFPRRNRIISGLSCGVVVVEAPEKSGSLITARLANDQGRDVFVVPGNIDVDGFKGSNQLLKDGAGAVVCGWDVMCEYEARFPDKIHRETAPNAKLTLPKDLPKLLDEEEEAPAKVAQKPRIPKKKQTNEGSDAEKDIDKEPSKPYIDLSGVLRKLSADEQSIVSALESGEKLVDDVIAQTGLSTGKVLCLLTMLEIKRVIVRLPGKRISLRET